jgi:predicted acetyltransferase
MEIRPVTADELPAYLRTAEGAFHEDVAPEDIEMDRTLVELERTLAAFDGPEIVGTTAILTRELTIPGAVMSVAGVTAVGVLATHRRRGLLTALMRRQLDDVRAAGESVAILWASEPVIYGRFGYGLAAAHASVTLRTAGARLHPAMPPPDGRWALLEPAAAVERIAPFYDRVRRGRVGHLDRTPPWWARRVWDPERHRDGRNALRAAVHESPEGEVDGYVLYAVKSDWSDGPNATATVREHVADGPAATAAVWSYLLGLDLTRTVECWIAAPDTPFADLVQGPQRTRMDLGQNLWVRLVDVPAALAARTYAAAIDVVLEVDDAFCPWNAGRFRLVASAPGSAATCERTDAPADLALSSNELGAAYLGGTSLAALQSIGRVREQRGGTLEPVATAFRGAREPYCPEIF